MRKTEDIVSREYFHERLEFVGTLSNGQESVDGLQIIIQYPLHHPGMITGMVLGTQETAHQLIALSNSPSPHLHLRARSRFETPPCFRYESDKVVCFSCTSRSEPPGALYIVAQLDLIELEEHTDFGSGFFRDPHTARDMPARYLSFYLSGPQTIWGIFWFIETSFTGNTRVDVRSSELILGNEIPFQVSVKPWFFTDPEVVEEAQDSYSQRCVYALRLETSLPTEEYSDDQFLTEGQSLANDLTLLASLGSRRRIVWYGYSLRTEYRLVKYHRTTPDVDARMVSWHSLPIQADRSRDYFAVTLSNLRELRSAGQYLEQAIEYYLIAQERERTPEEKFTNCFLALEKLKDMYAQRMGLSNILDRSQFRTMHSKLKEWLQTHYASLPGLDCISDKIPELNRYSLRYVVQHLMNDLDIGSADLYASGHDPFGFIATRNQLFHSTESVEIEGLFWESERLSYVVERILLRLLGWDDLSQSPDPSTKGWLSGHLDES